MYQSMLSGAYHGMESYLVHVEVDISDGLPCMEMIGYLASQVKESKERVRVGIKNSGYKIPPRRITISLTPADIRKDGSGFDLAVALGILLAAEGKGGRIENVLVLGELGLDGSVKSVRGVLPILLNAKQRGICCCIIPKENMAEARNVRGLKCCPVATLKEAHAFVGCLSEESLNTEMKRQEEKEETVEIVEHEAEYSVDFSQIAGQHQARRAAEIAAAGFHNLLLFGPPGSGKSMIAERIRTILPPMTYGECIEVTKIRSILGEMREKETIVIERPYEAVHHLVTPQGLLGGGTVPVPGIITRAHNGVLFLDELPEFGRAKLDLLRQPLEEKKIRIVRKQYVCDYPADFMLVAAMNPCPCGYFPDRNKCNCRSSEIASYMKRISGPLLDRFDLSVEVGKVDWEQLQCREPAEDSCSMRSRVQKAYRMQIKRQKKLNSDLITEEVEQVCEMSQKAWQMLQFAFCNNEKSVRSYDRMRKVARTIADLAESDRIEAEHMAEAIVLNGGMEMLSKKGDRGYA